MNFAFLVLIGLVICQEILYGDKTILKKAKFLYRISISLIMQGSKIKAADSGYATFQGYPYQYLGSVVGNLFGGSIVRDLSNAYSLSNLTKGELAGLGRIVDSGVKELNNPVTSDGYHWFLGLGYDLGRTNVAILFPWQSVPDQGLDRPISVYSTMRRKKEVEKLLEKFAYQIRSKSDEGIEGFLEGIERIWAKNKNPIF